ncbi:MAG: DEDD exonuclease domain-containing protein [Rubrobacteraceae bacterium]
MSPSLYRFVRDREPVSAEDICTELLRLPMLDGDAGDHVASLVKDDPRFLWNGSGGLRTADVGSLPLEEAPYVVFDLETTGTSAAKGGITELGAVKLVGGAVVEEFSTLVNPEMPITPFVVRLTGITNSMVADAPTVEEVMASFEEFVEGAVLVGHNVQFDASFVAAARGEPLPNPILDTLRLARTLVPGLRRYRLGSLAGHFGVRQVPNHRALSDAAATAEIFLKLSKLLRSAGVRTVGEAVTLRGGSRRRIKPQKQHLAGDLPNTPGVYYFVDKNGTVLYVGKAKDLRSRVRTYFNGGDGRRKIGRLVEEVAEVRYKETRSELYALIHEAREIKRLLPRYNSVGREPRASWFIKLDMNELYPVPERVPDSEPQESVTYLGPYRSARVLDTCIEALGRIFPLKQCSGEEGVCFYGQLGRCAPCMGMDAYEYRTEVLGQLTALMRGEGGEEHLAALARERDRLAGEQEFEAAARLRDLLDGIERIRLTRAVVSAEGVQVVVTPSTESGLVEVFAFSEGRLISHQGFEAGDAKGLSRFANKALSESKNPAAGVPDESRVVTAYLRRRSAELQVAKLRNEEDLLIAVRQFAGGAAETTNVASLT